MQSLQDNVELTPETEEYGISSFVYRARRPFHPQRLCNFMTAHFLLQEPDWSDAMADATHHNHTNHLTGMKDGSMQAVQDASCAVQHLLSTLESMVSSDIHQNARTKTMMDAAISSAAAAVAATKSVALLLSRMGHSDDAWTLLPNTTPNNHRSTQLRFNTAAHQHDKASKRRQRLFTSHGQVLRSKGFIWLSSRPELCGEWSHAGGILRFTVGGPWYAALPQEAWPESQEHRADIRKDFQGDCGDRRQELVFIGIDVKREALVSALNDCLLTDKEMEDVGWNGTFRDDDPFSQWPSLQQILDGGDDSDHNDHDTDRDHDIYGDDTAHQEDKEHVNIHSNRSHRDNESNTAALPNNKVVEIMGGAAEIQTHLNDSESGTTAIVHWHAPWCAQSVDVLPFIHGIASKYPLIQVFTVNVEASLANMAFAMEKVMERPSARREGAKLVLKMGRKFPCFTMHVAPSLQPTRVLAGDGVEEEVEQVLRDKGSSAPCLAQEVKLKQGAVEFKQLLLDAKNNNRDAVVVWTTSLASDPSYALHAAMETAVRQAVGMMGTSMECDVVIADVAISRANAILADALHVKNFPTVHIYREMKLEKKASGKDATPKALLDLFKISSSTTTAVDHQSNGHQNSNSSGDTHKSTTSSHGNSATEYDPPTGKYARPGAIKRMNNGKTGHFFPKMPCLRCGCPWWSSDEWDARCLRCGWDCERVGYDDDSNPLPAFRKKWELYTGMIKEGRTAEWGGSSSSRT